MKKRILGLAVALAMILSLNAVVIACPGGGLEGEPVICSCAVFVSLPIELPPDWEIDCPPPVDCPEDCQGEDDDNQQ